MTKSYKTEAIKGYKKQHGLHHKIDKKYGRVYWPYLPVLLLTAVGLSMGFFIAAQNPKSTTVSFSTMLNSVNDYRSKNGLNKLNYDKDLSTAAQIQANQIAISSSWSPLSKTQNPAFELVAKSSNFLVSPAENLAYGFSSSNSVISAWSNNSYQANNILNPKSNSVGYGIVTLPNFMDMKNQRIVVAIFADNKTLPSVALASSKSIDLNSSPHSVAIVRLNSIIKYDSVYELYILGALMAGVAVLIFSKHTLLIHKWVTQGEELASKHPLLDLALVASFIILASAIQTSGFIS